jgi:DNA-binding LytR/AlgR family response regulator
VDDEPLALQVIEQHLSKFGQFEVCGKNTEPLEAFAQIKRLQPDLLFLDIQMPEVTGLELIGSLHHKPDIILTTAYREYAVEGFEFNVLDYLVKPIPFMRFVKALDKFLEKQTSQTPHATVNNSASIFVKANRKTLRIDLNDILYVEGIKDYVKIVLFKQKILTKASIGNFFEDLPKDRFLRVHKSFIVAKNKVTAYTANDVEIGDIEIPIGRVFKDQIIRELEKGA